MRGDGRSLGKGSGGEIEEGFVTVKWPNSRGKLRKTVESVFKDTQNLTGQCLEQSELALKLAMLWSGFE